MSGSIVGTHVPGCTDAQGLSEITRTHPRNRKRCPPSANCGSTDGPFQVGCPLFTLHYQSNLPPCDFHLSACSQSCCSPTHTFATPWLISPLPLVACLSHCTAFSNTRQYYGPKPASYFTPKNGTRYNLHPAHTLFLNQSRLSDIAAAAAVVNPLKRNHRHHSATHTL